MESFFLRHRPRLQQIHWRPWPRALFGVMVFFMMGAMVLSLSATIVLYLYHGFQLRVTQLIEVSNANLMWADMQPRIPGTGSTDLAHFRWMSQSAGENSASLVYPEGFADFAYSSSLALSTRASVQRLPPLSSAIRKDSQAAMPFGVRAAFVQPGGPLLTLLDLGLPDGLGMALDMHTQEMRFLRTCAADASSPCARMAGPDAFLASLLADDTVSASPFGVSREQLLPRLPVNPESAMFFSYRPWLFPDDVRRPIEQTPPESWSARLMVFEIRERLVGKVLDSFEVSHPLPKLWVRVQMPHARYWLVLPTVRFAGFGQHALAQNIAQNILSPVGLSQVETQDHAPSLLRWLLFTLIGLIGLAVLISGGIAWRINKPLLALQRAARQLGRGVRPAPLEQSGPRELRALASSFNRMLSDLDQLENDRNLMLAGISHDLRTPLARLRLGVEMLEHPSGYPLSSIPSSPVEQAGGDTPDADTSTADQPTADMSPAHVPSAAGVDAAGVDDLRSGMQQDIEDIERILRQFIDYTRGQSEPSREIDPIDLARDLLMRYERSGKPVDLELPDELPPLYAQPLALVRALTNLLDNAHRYGQPPVCLRLYHDHAASRLCFEVSDHGPGIPGHLLERAQEPFQRLMPERRADGGSGLGFAIIKRILQRFGGELHLGNRPDGGLIAVLCLPVMNTEQGQKPGKKTGCAIER